MLGSLIYGRLLFDEPREAPATSWDAALWPRNSLAKLGNAVVNQDNDTT